MAKGLHFTEASLATMTATCKIQRRTIEEGHVVLRVSGQLTGDHVNTLRTVLEQESNAFTLDLADVRLADREGVKLLAVHELNGVRIVNCPLYIREWITRERDGK